MAPAIEGENKPPLLPPQGMNETKRWWGENETTKEGENSNREGRGEDETAHNNKEQGGRTI
jgi:hypothetical protein